MPPFSQQVPAGRINFIRQVCCPVGRSVDSISQISRVFPEINCLVFIGLVDIALKSPVISFSGLTIKTKTTPQAFPVIATVIKASSIGAVPIIVFYIEAGAGICANLCAIAQTGK